MAVATGLASSIAPGSVQLRAAPKLSLNSIESFGKADMTFVLDRCADQIGMPRIVSASSLALSGAAQRHACFPGNDELL
jgi:hypothetical protein